MKYLYIKHIKVSTEVPELIYILAAKNMSTKKVTTIKAPTQNTPYTSMSLEEEMKFDIPNCSYELYDSMEDLVAEHFDEFL